MYLNCHSQYSLRYGVLLEEELCALAKKNNFKQLALTDINSTSGCLQFVKHAQKQNIRPVVGIDFRNQAQQKFVGLAKNNVGFRNLNEFLSEHLHHKKGFEARAPKLEDCFLIYPFASFVAEKNQYPKINPKSLTANEFIGVSLKELNAYKFSTLQSYKHKVVLLQPVSFLNKKHFNTHRLLRAIDNNCLLSKLPEEQQGREEDTFYTKTQLLMRLKDCKYIIENTQLLLEKCKIDFSFDTRQNVNLQRFGASEKEDIATLKQLCYKNLNKRYPNASQKVHERLEKELQAIIKMQFVSYFLINLDIVEYAKRMDFPFIGRGSGANSIVAYILGITNVDPIELDLYFERFINSNRSSPPDFDIDFSWKDREQVTQYIFEKYKNTALMGTYVSFKRKAVMREIGKVFGLPKENIDKLSAGYYHYKNLDKLEQLVVKYGKYIEGLPNYVSVHSGGILILNASVYNFAATFLPPKGFETIQIDMNISEEVGIHKFDILAQRGLSKIKDAVALVKENQPNASIKNLEEVKVFKEDPAINQLLKTGDCMGVFYIESPAMRGLLTKLQTDNYLNLVAASSIIRPGVSSAGMKEEFIKRHRFPRKRKEAHPVLYKIMPDTYGVMVYQEDVMKVAHHFAGLDLEDADVLRRGMSGKKTSKEKMQSIETKFKENCKQRQHNPALVEEIWTQISSFAGYAFPKGHSASYAVESYQSLYLKCYFPLEFMVAAINNGGGFYRVETYLREIENHGGELHLPCVNKSDHPTAIYGKKVYLGLGYLKELEQKTIRDILENRQFYGEFLSLENFLERVAISIEQLSILIKIEAFRFTEKNKYELLWKAHFIQNKNKIKTNQEMLFRSKMQTYTLPSFKASFLAQSYDQINLLGFSLGHPFKLLQDKIDSKLTAANLLKYKDKSVVIYGDLITIKTTKTSKGEYMYFGTFYDYKFQVFDTVHFPKIAQQYPVRAKGIYRCVGLVKEEMGYVSLQITKITHMPIMPDERYVGIANYKRIA